MKMPRAFRVLLGLILRLAAARASTCASKSINQFSILGPKDMPLCGNGELDAGEVCDDGNRVGGDGCNGWCSAFDRMTKACTLAGQNRECTRGTTLASSPSQSSFCRLASVAIAPDGKYLVVADGTSLVRMDLFTDSVMENLAVLSASGSAEFGRFCSVFVISGSYRRIVGGEGDANDKDDIIVAHDCEKQNIVVFIYEGSTYVIKTPLQLQSHMKGFKGYLDQEAKQLVVAGLPLAPDGLRCVDVFTVDLETYKVALLGSLECVAFNVVEAGKQYPSFSMDGMTPYRILREACPFQMSSPLCYAIYMERNDMQLAKGYISVDGGTDAEYVVSTDEKLNVLGAPLVTRSEKSKITYTLTGNCFTAANTILSDMKSAPPMFALGYSCGTLPIGKGECSTPLNNPFITDIVSSSYLLPSGLSATHEHNELLAIFTNGNASALLANSTQSGLTLYRQILDNTHRGNVPIDFVEHPLTQDVIYITETTIGLINSKGMMLMDLYNPGYCRAIDTILCPPGFFGAVGGTCRPCAEDEDEPVSAQIQCTGQVKSGRRRGRRLLSVFQSAPYTQLSMVVSNKVRKNDIDTLMKFFLIAHGYNCSDASAMTGYQPYNMAADIQDANQKAPDGKCTQLVPCIIESAGANIKRNLSLAVPEEYLISWTLQNSSLVNALTKIGVSRKEMTILPTDRDQAARCGLSSDTVDRLEDGCMVWINSDFHKDWLPCALGVLNSSRVDVMADRRRRHLLQEAGGQPAVTMLVVPQTQGTFMSGTSISWGVLSRPTPPSPNNNNNQKPNPNGAEDSGIFVIVVVAGVVAGVLIAILIIGIFYVYFRRARHAATAAHFPAYAFPLKSR
jgi:cysteine-rich repeat protein